MNCCCFESQAGNGKTTSGDVLMVFITRCFNYKWDERSRTNGYPAWKESCGWNREEGSIVSKGPLSLELKRLIFLSDCLFYTLALGAISL